MSKNIFLLGMPSSGKSTLGKQIAKLLNYEFVDLDNKIVASEGKTVSEIFTLKGEDHFRKVETEQLKKIVPNQKIVIATGGGTPCSHENMGFIKENGVSIYLDVPPDKLYERMNHSNKSDRPLFNLANEALKEAIKERYDQRSEFYRQADLLVEGDTNAESILWLLEFQGVI